MRNERGSALLMVTILGVIMVLMAIGLISFSHSMGLASHNLDTQAIARYAAEAGIADVKANLKFDDEANVATFWTADRYVGLQPNYTKQIGKANVAVSFFVVDLPTNKFRAEVIATVDKAQYKMNMEFTYAAAAEPGADSMFSKYSMFVNNDMIRIGNVQATGYYHCNRYIEFMTSGARFYKEITARDYFSPYGSGVNYTTPYSMPAPWDQMFQSTANPSHNPTHGEVEVPTYAEIEADLLPIAMDPSRTPQKFWIDPANPYYADIAASMTYSHVTFAHDAATQRTTATIQIKASDNATVLRTETQVIDPTVDTMIFSKLSVQTVKGTLYGRVALACAHKGNWQYDSSYGTNILWPSSTVIRDSIIYVDQNGNPKTWVYNGADNTPIPQPGGKYNFPGIPNSSSTGFTDSNSATWHVENMYATWDNSNYKIMNNPNFNPTVQPCLGIISNGDVTMASNVYNGMFDVAVYTADVGKARMRTLLSTGRGNALIYGSVTSQKFPINTNGSGGFVRSRHYIYDPQLLEQAPPFYVALPELSASASVAVTYGSIWGGPM